MDYFIYQIPMPNYLFDHQGHIGARSGEEEEETVDPRWEALLKLKK